MIKSKLQCLPWIVSLCFFVSHFIETYKIEFSNPQIFFTRILHAIQKKKITNEIDRLLNRQLLDLSFCCNCSFVRSVLRFSSIFIYLSLRKFIRNLHQSYVRKRKKNQQQHKPTNDIIISCFSFFVGEGKKYIESTRRQQRKLKK